MQKILLFFLFCSQIAGVFSQTSQPKVNARERLDSLKQVWENKTLADTARLEALHNMLKTGYDEKYPDSVIYFAKLGLQVSDSESISTYQAQTFFLMAEAYQRTGELGSAFSCFSQGLDISETLGYKRGIALGSGGLGVLHLNQGEYDLALPFLETAKSTWEELGNKQNYTISLGNIAVILKNKGDYAKAIDYNMQMLKVGEATDNKRLMAFALRGISVIYANQKDYQKAIEYFKKSIQAAEEGNNLPQAARSQNALGYTYLEINEYDLALQHLQKGLEIYEQIGQRLSSTEVLTNMGIAYKKMGDFKQADEYFRKSLAIREEEGNQFQISTVLLNLAGLAQEQHNYQQAITYGRRALPILLAMDAKPAIAPMANILYKSYKALGNKSKALEMHELFTQTNDSLNSEKNVKETIRQAYQYQYEKRALADSLIQVEKNLQTKLAFQAQLHKKDQLRNVLIAIGVIALLLVIGFWTRIQYIRRTNIQLQASKNRAERSESHKQQFLANMSHEIRTPVHAISGMVKILERNKHLSEQEVFLQAMHQSSDNLIVLLNDILDLSKIEAGKLDVESIPMQPVTVINNLHQILQFKAEEKGLELHTTIADELPTVVMGDPARLSQILTNLVGNAIKFTEKGSVSISVSKKNNFIRYEIHDTGIGISEDNLQSIFEAFEQAESYTARKFGGTGLGLNISRQLVELQGGSIWAESEVGKGSTFFVSLPLIAIEEDVNRLQDLNEEQLLAMGAKLRQKRFLLVEDNEFNQMIALDDLAYYIPEVQIEIAENGVEGLEKYQTGQYDLVLMDVQMPLMDGYEATLKIRAWEQENDKKPIPIVAMTASVLKSEVNLCFEAGMTNYIPKPYQAEELVGAIYEELSTENK